MGLFPVAWGTFVVRLDVEFNRRKIWVVFEIFFSFPLNLLRHGISLPTYLISLPKNYLTCYRFTALKNRFI